MDDQFLSKQAYSTQNSWDVIVSSWLLSANAIEIVIEGPMMACAGVVKTTDTISCSVFAETIARPITLSHTAVEARVCLVSL